MAQTITVLPELVTATGTSNEELTIDQRLFNTLEHPILFIEVVSGTFYFAAGQDASNSSASWQAGDKFPISLRNKDYRRPALKLNFKASASGDTFRVSGV